MKVLVSCALPHCRRTRRRAWRRTCMIEVGGPGGSNLLLAQLGQEHEGALRARPGELQPSHAPLSRCHPILRFGLA